MSDDWGRYHGCLTDCISYRTWLTWRVTTRFVGKELLISNIYVTRLKDACVQFRRYCLVNDALSNERGMQGSAQFQSHSNQRRGTMLSFGVLNYNLDTYIYDVVGTVFKNE